jgi:hypothetical protein
MTKLSATLSLHQLKQAVQLKEQITVLENELAAILGGSVAEPAITTAPVKTGRGGARTMSPEARARIAAAQKARWAVYRQSKGTAPKSIRAAKRTISPIHRARLAAAQKARWAKYRKAKGN